VAVYSVIGTTASAFGANALIAQLWNPHASRAVRVLEVFWGISGDTGSSTLQHNISRSTARGATPTSTVTPGAVDADDNLSAPPTGTVLEMGVFGTPPTLATPPLCSPMVHPMFATNTQPFWHALFPYSGGIVVPPSGGLVIHQVDTEGFTNNQAGFVFED
jgi:hypothetical protein